MSRRGFFSIKIDIFDEDQCLNMEGYIQPPFIPTWALPSQRLKIWKETGADYIKSSKYQIESVLGQFLSGNLTTEDRCCYGYIQ
jgi:hypothetical protein